MPSPAAPSAAIRFRVNECESWLRDSARRSGAVARASAARSRCTTRRKRAANGRWAPSTPSSRHALPADWPSRRSPRGEAGGPMRPWLSLPRAGSNSTRDRRSRRTSATRRRSSLSSTSTEPSLGPRRGGRYRAGTGTRTAMDARRRPRDVQRRPPARPGRHQPVHESAPARLPRRKEPRRADARRGRSARACAHEVWSGEVAHTMYALVSMAAFVGMRPGELYGLRWSFFIFLQRRDPRAAPILQGQPVVRAAEERQASGHRAHWAGEIARVLEMPRPLGADELNLPREPRGADHRARAALLLAPHPLPVRQAVDGPRKSCGAFLRVMAVR